MARIEIIVGRIETLAVDAVVNAANRRLLPGTGVDGALRAAAGPELTQLTDAMSPLSESEAVITPGFNAPATYIIHVAAPIYFEPGDQHEKIFKLGACYQNVIALAQTHNVQSVAFPCLGTGNYGWPANLACGVAMTHIDAALTKAPGIQRVVFCCFSASDAALYEAGLRGELR